MQIKRELYAQLQAAIQPQKVVILYGPRRAGKTTLLEKLVSETALPYIKLSGDNVSEAQALSIPDVRALAPVIGRAKLVVIDEAQRIKNIGSCLKIIIDQIPGISVVISGSAALEVSGATESALTGRNKHLVLYPLSFTELSKEYGGWEAKNQLERWLIWGGYPEAVLITGNSEREEYLETLVGSYLYKDILELGGLRKPEIIVRLLQMLAFQIGQEVSHSELARNLSVSVPTIQNYLYLLEQSFIIFSHKGLSRNLRKEVYKTCRYYFWDTGVRNALIRQWNGLAVRNDVGQLWENYLTVERRKWLEYHKKRPNVYFWRTYDQKELDWVEEDNGLVTAYEFKWSDRAVKKATRAAFTTAYPGAKIVTVTRENMTEFLPLI